jgi:hypothetical protein
MEYLTGIVKLWRFQSKEAGSKSGGNNRKTASQAYQLDIQRRMKAPMFSRSAAITAWNLRTNVACPSHQAPWV